MSPVAIEELSLDPKIDDVEDDDEEDGEIEAGAPTTGDAQKKKKKKKRESICWIWRLICSQKEEDHCHPV